MEEREGERRGQEGEEKEEKEGKYWREREEGERVRELNGREKRGVRGKM